MKSLKDIFFPFRKPEPEVDPGPQPHRGIDYTAGIKDMQDAYEAFDQLMLGVKRAAGSTESLIEASGARKEIEQRNILHQKAKKRRQKRKRGGPK